MVFYPISLFLVDLWLLLAQRVVSFVSGDIKQVKLLLERLLVADFNGSYLKKVSMYLYSHLMPFALYPYHISA